MNRIEEHLQCLLCRDKLYKPKLLPCQHMFCLKCLEDMDIRPRNRFRCPKCRAKHEIPRNGMSGFPTCRLAQKIIDAIEFKQPTRVRGFDDDENIDDLFVRKRSARVRWTDNENTDDLSDRKRSARVRWTDNENTDDLSDRKRSARVRWTDDDETRDYLSDRKRSARVRRTDDDGTRDDLSDRERSARGRSLDDNETRDDLSYRERSARGRSLDDNETRGDLSDRERSARGRSLDDNETRGDLSDRVRSARGRSLDDNEKRGDLSDRERSARGRILDDNKTLRDYLPVLSGGINVWSSEDDFETASFQSNVAVKDYSKKPTSHRLLDRSRTIEFEKLPKPILKRPKKEMYSVPTRNTNQALLPRRKQMDPNSYVRAAIHNRNEEDYRLNPPLRTKQRQESRGTITTEYFAIKKQVERYDIDEKINILQRNATRVVSRPSNSGMQKLNVRDSFYDSDDSDNSLNSEIRLAWKLNGIAW